MSEKIAIALQERTVVGKKVSGLRRQGILPATVYGKTFGPYTVQLDARTFDEILRKQGRNVQVELTVPGQAPVVASIHVIQRHPVTRNVLHVDFYVASEE
jgi:large subunit ribosomal protein L25